MLDDFEVTFRNDRGNNFGGERMVQSRNSRHTNHEEDRNPRNMPLPPDRSIENPPPPPDRNAGAKEEPSDEQMRTLWVGGLSDKVEEEVLYELFLNAGPLQRLSHPVDRDTKKKKSFAFIVYEHRESIKYAFDIFNGIELYGQRLRLQQKETGLGIHVGRGNPSMFNGHEGRDRGFGGGHSRSYSASSLPRSSQQQYGRIEGDVWNQPPHHHQQSFPPHQFNTNFSMQQQFGGGGGTGYNRGFQHNDHYSPMQDRSHREDRRRDYDDRFADRGVRDVHRDDRHRDRDYRDRSHHREYDSRGPRR